MSGASPTPGSDLLRSDRTGLVLRFATVDDVEVILAFIRGLAAYEELAHEVVADEDTLRHSLFGGRPAAEVLIAELDGGPAGFAVFFPSFSTFLGKAGLYLEDLFVLPELRGRGVGRELLACLARIALARDCGRLEWSVLDWNEPAIRFYQRLGAEPMDGWTVNRVTGSALAALARP